MASDSLHPQHNDGMPGGPPRIFTLVETNSGVKLAGSCVRGIARSTDDGLTWHPAGEIGHVSINTMQVADDGVVIAATSGGLARSTDDGENWEFLDATPRYAVPLDGNEGPDGETVFRIVRLSDGRPLAGTGGNGLWVYESERWRQLGLDGTIVYSILETDDGVLIVGTRGDGAFRSTDGGTSWRSIDEGLPDVYVHSLLQRPEGILAGTGTGIAISTDLGESWQSYAADFVNYRIFSMANLSDGRMVVGTYERMWIGSQGEWVLVDPGLTPDEAWSVHFDREGTLIAGARIGVLRSNDGGATLSTCGTSSLAMGFCETEDGELLMSSDDGLKRAPNWESHGLEGNRIRPAITIAPGVMLAGGMGAGLFRYAEGEWSTVADAPPFPLIYDLEQLPSGRIVMAASGIVDGAKDGGIYTSDDLGLTWTERVVGRNMYEIAWTSDGMLYVGGQRCHIYRSADEGETWEVLDPPFDFEAKLYCLIPDGDVLYLGAGNQLLRSDDKAETWTLLEEGLDGVTVYAIAMAGNDRMAVATSSGVFHSSDSGATWTAGELVG